MRRALLGLIPGLLARGDGLVPPMNAPQTGQVAIGVQPGSPGVVVATRVIVISSAPGTGVFVYSGKPGHGNPPIAFISDSAADPFGNALPPLIIGVDDPGVGTAGFDSSGQLDFTPASDVSGSVIAGVGGGTLHFTSGQHVLADTSAVMELDSSGVSGYPTLQLSASTRLVTAGGTAASPTLISTDSWHAMSLANGWANVGGFVAARYRLRGENMVEVQGAISAAAATASTFWVAPAGPPSYVPNPSGGGFLVACSLGINTLEPAGSNAWVRMDPATGNLTVQNTDAVGAAWQGFFHGFYPLD